MSVAASNVPTLGYNLVVPPRKTPAPHKLQQFCGSNTDLWPWLFRGWAQSMGRMRHTRIRRVGQCC